jgi:ribonuclease HII
MPDFSIENHYSGIIVAIDEVGRGPWAGPVMAAAAILDTSNFPSGIDDSKKLTAAKRASLAQAIKKCARVEIGIASVEEIEELNILQATKLAMCRAYSALNVTATVALIDGNQPPPLPCPTHCVVKGDSISMSIAAASIVAKVTRDRLMAELAKLHPGYGWETNAGYGTPQHQTALKEHGVTPHHRRTWEPIRLLLAQGALL